jgi:hypothetical protein
MIEYIWGEVYIFFASSALRSMAYHDTLVCKPVADTPFWQEIWTVSCLIVISLLSRACALRLAGPWFMEEVHYIRPAGTHNCILPENNRIFRVLAQHRNNTTFKQARSTWMQMFISSCLYSRHQGILWRIWFLSECVWRWDGATSFSCLSGESLNCWHVPWLAKGWRATDNRCDEDWTRKWELVSVFQLEIPGSETAAEDTEVLGATTEWRQSRGLKL